MVKVVVEPFRATFVIVAATLDRRNRTACFKFFPSEVSAKYWQIEFPAVTQLRGIFNSDIESAALRSRCWLEPATFGSVDRWSLKKQLLYSEPYMAIGDM